MIFKYLKCINYYLEIILKFLHQNTFHLKIKLGVIRKDTIKPIMQIDLMFLKTCLNLYKTITITNIYID